jgi:hypothetical protein
MEKAMYSKSIPSRRSTIHPSYSLIDKNRKFHIFPGQKGSIIRMAIINARITRSSRPNIFWIVSKAVINETINIGDSMILGYIDKI